MDATINKHIAVIAGAGPAGLTAAYELLTQCRDIIPVVIEKDSIVGGISRTVSYKGNHIDIGGHRFFSKSPRVTDWWNDIMPMLNRKRVSRILYRRHFFDYPISLSFRTFKNLGFANSMKAGCGYLKATMHKRKVNSLEDFYINRFGRQLYSMFFEHYTEKVWGIHPSRLGADWGAQRVKGVSVYKILADAMSRAVGKKNRKVETSLIEQFIYPKHGPGELWETVASKVTALGGEIRLNTEVTGVELSPDGARVVSVTVTDLQGNSSTIRCDYFLSSIPIKQLVSAISGITLPTDVAKTASGLKYRDFITVGLLVDKLKLTDKKSGGRLPDTWIYIQEDDVNIGRLQVFNNWSPYMVADNENTTWLGLEFFCNEGDQMWSMPENEFIDMAIDELVKINFIDASSVLDAVQIKMQKAYPVYIGEYYNLDTVRSFIDTVQNLFCIGRNGQHRYNNMDHSMLTAMHAVDCIANRGTLKSDIWKVNTENEYHESK